MAGEASAPGLGAEALTTLGRALAHDDDELDICVVVPTYRRPDRIARLITALGSQTLDPLRFEVVVVDDCSGDGTEEVLKDLAAKAPFPLHLLTSPVNGGPGAARNRGWRSARSDLVAFIDDDCMPDAGWLAAGITALRRNDRLGVVQGLTLPPPGVGPGSHWAIVRAVTWESPWFEACNIFYRRAALAATSGFNERLPWCGEDTAAGWAVVDAGWERDFATDAVVFHDVEERGVRWRMGRAWLERNLVDLALDHPGLRRDAFWRPWAFRADGVALAVALLAATSARRHPLRLAGVVPYLVMRRLPLRRPGVAAGTVAVDLAQLAGHLVASARRGRLVL